MKSLDESFQSVWEKWIALTEGSVGEMIISHIVEDVWVSIDVIVGKEHIQDDLEERL